MRTLRAVAGILLIEDDAAARHLLRALLERDSHTVWESASPDEAWTVLEDRAAPDLAIVDLRLGAGGEGDEHTQEGQGERGFHPATSHVYFMTIGSAAYWSASSVSAGCGTPLIEVTRKSS